jgi:hypothetical protein
MNLNAMKCLQGDIQQEYEDNAQNRPSIVASMASGVEGLRYPGYGNSASASSTVVGMIPPEIHAIRFRGHIADEEEDEELKGYDNNFFLGNHDAGAASKIIDYRRHDRDDALDETPVVISNRIQDIRYSFAHNTSASAYTRLDATADINDALTRGFLHLMKGRGSGSGFNPHTDTRVYSSLSRSSLSTEEVVYLRAEDSLTFFPAELKDLLFWLRDRYFPSGLRLTNREFDALVTTLDQLTLAQEHTQRQDGDDSNNDIISRYIRFSTFSAWLRQSIEVLLANRIVDDNNNSVSLSPVQPEELPSDAYLPDTVIEVMRRNAASLATTRVPTAAAAAAAIPAPPATIRTKYTEVLPSAESVSMGAGGFNFMYRGAELASEDLASILGSDTNIGTQYARTQLSPSIHDSVLSGFDGSYGDDNEIFVDLEDQEVTTVDSFDDLN